MTDIARIVEVKKQDFWDTETHKMEEPRQITRIKSRRRSKGRQCDYRVAPTPTLVPCIVEFL